MITADLFSTGVTDFICLLFLSNDIVLLSSVIGVSDNSPLMLYGIICMWEPKPMIFSLTLFLNPVNTLKETSITATESVTENTAILITRFEGAVFFVLISRLDIKNSKFIFVSTDSKCKII